MLRCVFVVMVLVGRIFEVSAQIDFEKLPCFRGVMFLDSLQKPLRKAFTAPIGGYQISGNNQEMWISEYESGAYDKYLDRAWFKRSYNVRKFEEGYYYFDGSERKPDFNLDTYAYWDLVIPLMNYPSSMRMNLEEGDLKARFYINADSTFLAYQIYDSHPLIEKLNRPLLDSLSKVPCTSFLYGSKSMPSYFEFALKFAVRESELDTMRLGALFIPFSVPRWTEDEQNVLSKYDIRFVQTPPKVFDDRLRLNVRLMDQRCDGFGSDWYASFEAEMLENGNNWKRFTKRNGSRKMVLKMEGFPYTLHYNKGAVATITFHPNGLMKRYISVHKAFNPDMFTIYYTDFEYDMMGGLLYNRSVTEKKSMF